MFEGKELVGGVNIIKYKNFLTEEECQKLIDFYNSRYDRWNQICFYNSYGMGVTEPLSLENGKQPLLDDVYIENLKKKMEAYCSDASGRPMKVNSMHAQKWEVGAYASDHSDNSDLEGNPSGWSDNKYFSGVYLNEDYEGGLLGFRDHDIKLKLNAGDFLTFPGGVENIHSVSEITAGTRYTLIVFWDYADSEYTQEEIERRQADIARERVYQYKLKQEWKQGNGHPIIEDPYAPIEGVEFDEKGNPINKDESNLSI